MVFLLLPFLHSLPLPYLLLIDEMVKSLQGDFKKLNSSLSSKQIEEEISNSLIFCRTFEQARERITRLFSDNPSNAPITPPKPKESSPATPKTITLGRKKKTDEQGAPLSSPSETKVKIQEVQQEIKDLFTEDPVLKDLQFEISKGSMEEVYYSLSQYHDFLKKEKKSRIQAMDYLARFRLYNKQIIEMGEEPSTTDNEVFNPAVHWDYGNWKDLIYNDLRRLERRTKNLRNKKNEEKRKQAENQNLDEFLSEIVKDLGFGE